MEGDPVPVADAARRSLGRKQRLTRPSEFRQVFDSGSKTVGRFMVMWMREVPESSRIGVVASKRSIGNAVQRNKAKRKLREAFRLHQDRLTPGFEMVLIARQPILDASGDTIGNDFCNTAGKAGMLVELHEEE